MAKKKQPTKAPHSKLIVPGAETRPKTQLLVPDAEVGKTSARLSVPGADELGTAQPNPMIEAAGQPETGGEGELADQFTVINEDASEPVAAPVSPVKITAMVPPPAESEAPPELVGEPEEEVIEPVIAVAMAAPPAYDADEEAAVEEQSQDGPEYAEEATYDYEQQADPAAYAAQEETYDAEPSQAYEGYEGYEGYQQPAQQPSYYDPGQAQIPAPAPVPAPSFAPPPPAPAHYQQPPYQQAPPPMMQPPHYGYAPQAPPPGYRMPGQMPGQMYGGLPPQRSVPSWALVLVGTLVGFLMAMAIFKFTGMGEALRGDLIEEGKKRAEEKFNKQKKNTDGYPEEEEEEEEAAPKPDPKEKDAAADEDKGTDDDGKDAPAEEPEEEK